MPSFRNVRPCTFVGYEFAGKLASVWNHGHPRPRMYIRVHLWATNLQANSLLYGTTDIPAHECTSVYICGLRVCKQTRYCSISRTSLSVLQSLSPLAFLKIACPEVYIRVHFFPTYFRVCREKTSFIQNSLLINIPPVLGRSDDGFLRRKNIAAE